MKVFEDLYGYAAIENDVIKNCARYIKKDSSKVENIVIVGAYHGYEIDKMMLEYPNAKFIAFEPFPKNFQVLQSRYANNAKVRCLNYACSDFIGTADFHELSAAGNGSLLKVSNQSVYKLQEVETVTVQVTTLDAAVQDLAIDLLWMDVQGNELNVLKGYQNQNALSMFLEIAIEGHGHESYEGNCHLSDLETYLTKYALHSIGLDNELKNGTGNSFWVRNV